MEQKIETIQKYLTDNKYYKDDDIYSYDEKTVDIILKVIGGDVQESYIDDDEEGIIAHYIGLYYRVNKNDELTEKYYLMSIDKGMYLR